MLMTNIPIAKVTDENITIATVISHEEYLNTAILNENSNPREMINQVAALEVVCQENSENVPPGCHSWGAKNEKIQIS